MSFGGQSPIGLHVQADDDHHHAVTARQKGKGMLHGLDLFSGIGGNTLALRGYIKTIAYCEQDRHAQAVLLSRMGDGSIAPAPIWDDIRTLGAAQLDIPIDIIVGGFPCQDISVAGVGKGLAGERSGLVFEIFRLITELAPAFVFLENVPSIRTRGGERVVKELAGLGYDCRWDMLSAYDVGAPHKRERWFLLARRRVPNSRCEHDQPQSGSLGGAPGETGQQERGNGPDSLDSNVSDPKCGELRDEPGRRRGPCGEITTVVGNHGEAWPMANTNGTRLEIGSPWKPEQCSATIGKGWWQSEPDVGRVANGIPNRVDRIKRLGNAVVPAQAREAFKRLMGLTLSAQRLGSLGDTTSEHTQVMEEVIDERR